jgi:hypothetical protein
MSSCAERGMGWYKPYQHLSPVDFHIPQATGEALQHLYLVPFHGRTSLGKGIGGPAVEVIQAGSIALGH